MIEHHFLTLFLVFFTPSLTLFAPSFRLIVVICERACILCEFRVCVRYGHKIYLLDCKMHDMMLSVSCFEGFLLYFCLFFNLQSVLFSLHHLFGFIGSMASLIICTCFAIVFHMKCVFIWNLAIFIFCLKNFHMKWFFFILFNSN